MPATLTPGTWGATIEADFVTAATTDCAVAAAVVVSDTAASSSAAPEAVAAAVVHVQATAVSESGSNRPLESTAPPGGEPTLRPGQPSAAAAATAAPPLRPGEFATTLRPGVAAAPATVQPLRPGVASVPLNSL